MPPAGYPRASAAASAMDHQVRLLPHLIAVVIIISNLFHQMRSFLSPEEFNAFEDGGLQAFDQLDAQNEGLQKLF